MPHKNFVSYSKEDILQLTHIRRFETKIGERVQTIQGGQEMEAAIEATGAKYVVFGIPEDIGVKANLGRGGAESGWMPFLSAFLNVQSNDFLSGDDVLILGHFDFTALRILIENNASTDDERIEAYRHAVNFIDEQVENLVKVITSLKKVPILIGGGHNNAYPAMKGAAKGLFKAELIPLAQINCVNLDAHADYRPMEGRHSGNAFRYAEEDGYLGKYCVIGLHENYLQQNVWIDIVNNPFVDCITYEDIFILEKRNFTQAVAHAVSFTEETYTGVELDLDSIEHVLASASSPSGVSVLHARQYMSYVANDAKVAYVHICEGATKLADGTVDPSTGKLLSYLVSDFIKGNLNRNEGE